MMRAAARLHSSTFVTLLEARKTKESQVVLGFLGSTKLYSSIKKSSSSKVRRRARKLKRSHTVRKTPTKSLILVV